MMTLVIDSGRDGGWNMERKVRSGCRVRQCGSARFMRWGGGDNMNEISEDNALDNDLDQCLCFTL